MKRFALRPGTVARSRWLRRAMTPWERRLWRSLRETFPEAHFRTQVPIGPYHADFAWHKAKLIIEVDGSQHGTDNGQADDAVRTAFLEREGYRVLRFWNNEIRDNLDGVMVAIAALLPPCGGDKRGGRGASAPQKTLEAPKFSLGAQTHAAPTPTPPHKGEGVHLSL